MKGEATLELHLYDLNEAKWRTGDSHKNMVIDGHAQEESVIGGIIRFWTPAPIIDSLSA